MGVVGVYVQVWRMDKVDRLKGEVKRVGGTALHFAKVSYGKNDM